MSTFNPEDALLRSLMQDGASYWRIAETVCPDDFSPKGRRLFVAISDAVKAGEPCDVVTLADSLGDELGREAMDIGFNAMGVAANIESYAKLVAERGEARRVKHAGQRIALAGSYSEAQALLAEVRPMQASRMKSVTEGLKEMVLSLQRRYDATGDVTGVTTSIDSLDAITAGWQPGDLVVCAARPAMGKTAFALQAAIAAGRTLFLSLEMTAGSLMERAVCSVGQIPGRWLKLPKDAPDEALTMVLAASRVVATLPLLIDDQPGLTVDAICARIRQAHMEEPLKLIVVDHLGIVGRDGKHDASELGAITAQLKRVAKETGSTVLLLCQLNRSLESRPDKRPLMSDLRDSGRIEEDADMVIALYRDEVYNPTGPLAGRMDESGKWQPGYMEILIRKHRSGELGTAWARANLGFMRLESCDEPANAAANAGGNGLPGHGQTRFTKSREPRPLAVAS